MFRVESVHRLVLTRKNGPDDALIRFEIFSSRK